MKKIKVLFTINYLTNGGPTRVLQNIIYGMKKENFDISILTLIDKNNKNIVNELQKRGVKIIEMKLSNLGIFLSKNKIIKIIQEIDPQIIHVHGIEMSYVVSSKKIDAIKLTTIHNSLYEDYKYAYGKIKGKLIEWLHISCLKKMDENICCSETSYKYLSQKISNVSYIRNGVIVNHNKKSIRNELRTELGFKDDDIVFVYGGVISNRKRVFELIKLFTEFGKENEYLLIVGDGPLLNSCKEIANKNVVFVGFKTNIIDYFDASDVYISYSSAEGFSISLIEAFSSGLICLISDIPSHLECFNIDKNYYIGESFNIDNFKNKKDIISEKIKNIDKKKIMEFQNNYLSSESMSKLYCEKYDRWVNR